MTEQRNRFVVLGSSLVVAVFVAATAAVTPQSAAPLTIGSGRVTIDGTSNVHEYSAATTTMRVTAAKVAPQVAGAGLWAEIVKPGVLQAFDIVVPAGTLKSGDDGLDKNMYKALQTTTHPDITFRLAQVAAGTTPGSLAATGTLTIAGVEKRVTFAVTTEPKAGGLAVKGETHLVMTDFGIKPPKAMLGLLKTDPKVTVTFEVMLASGAAGDVQ